MIRSRVSQVVRSLFIFALIIAACVATTETGPSFRFVFMTDIHVQPELNAEQGLRTAIAKVNTLQPDFVITGGDLVMDALGQTFERADMLYNLYATISKNFNMPVYNGIGNHEVFGLFEKSGISPDHPEYAKQMFKNRLGEGTTYRSFDHKGWHFVMLDGIGLSEDRKYIGEVDQQQLNWLKSDLGKIDQSTPVVVIVHIPLLSVGAQLDNGATAAFGPSGVVTNSKEVLDVLNQKNTRLVLQGHLHIVEEIIVRNTHFITGGSVAAGWWKGPHKGFPEGFVVVDVTGDDFDWHYETFGWKAVTE